MAWVKIPQEHHSIFLAAVPKDPRVTTLKMFGGIAAKVSNQMFAGLFAKSFIVKLSESDRAEALELDGAEVFDPMGNGRLMKDTIQMPEETFGDDAELRSWLTRGLAYTLTLPAKATKATKATIKATTKPVTKPAVKATVAKPVSKPTATQATRPIPNKTARKTPAKKRR